MSQNSGAGKHPGPGPFTKVARVQRASSITQAHGHLASILLSKASHTTFLQVKKQGSMEMGMGVKYFLNGDLLRLSFSVRRQLNGFQNLMVK